MNDTPIVFSHLDSRHMDAGGAGPLDAGNKVGEEGHTQLGAGPHNQVA